MDFSEIVGQNHIKSHLSKTVQNGRIPHAQLFVGQTGNGLLPMALAYASAILTQQYNPETTEHQRVAENVRQLSHPDLHFVFPINKTDRVKKHPVSSLFLEEWRQFVRQRPYGSLFEWLKQLGIENKQGNINVDEAADMLKSLSLKSYEGGYKVVIIWMADRMNTACSNKILKLVEEPPEKTVLLLLTEKEEQLLGTIRSRCQTLHFPRIAETDIVNRLVQKKQISLVKANTVAQQALGNYHKALELIAEGSDDAEFENLFVLWVRSAFKAKGNKKAIHDLLSWSENLAREGRETQKKFLQYCIDVFRQALLKNYKSDSLLFFESATGDFSIEKFAPFVHQNNVFEITEALENAIYHIERNGNAKIIFSDMSIQLTRLIHRKP